MHYYRQRRAERDSIRAKLAKEEAAQRAALQYYCQWQPVALPVLCACHGSLTAAQPAPRLLNALFGAQRATDMPSEPAQLLMKYNQAKKRSPARTFCASITDYTRKRTLFPKVKVHLEANTSPYDVPIAESEKYP